ncbi:MAG TPA: tetratricopeptide repeat protein, partial [Polyangia bacterium]|nr:tetratricopeptide repeat protein [Polyangia bacterium]
KAKAERADEAREYLDKATAAFALNRFSVAAENYEKSFELKPDAAVLYNAAQAYRLAGNKERALELYQSYLRMYGSEKRAEIEKHIENLKQAIEKDHAVATSPPTTPAPVGGATAAGGAGAPVASTPGGSTIVPTTAGSPSAVPSAPPPSSAQSAPVLVAQPAQSSEQGEHGSVTSKPWFWAVLGGVVVAAVVSTLLLARREPSDPTSTLTPVDGN